MNDWNSQRLHRTLGMVRCLITALAVTLACGGAALAHHSSAMYDPSKLMTLRGTVTQFRWTNPHVTISVMTDAAPGEEGQLWILEATSPGNLSRDGWTRTSIAQGSRIEVVIAPLRNGDHGGWCRTVKLPDVGRMLEC